MNSQTFTQIVNESNQRLYLLAMSYVHNHHDAEDIIQNCYLKLWKHNEEFETQDHANRWLTVVCINECKNLLKSSSKKKTVSLEEAKELYSFNTEKDASLFEAVMSLPTKESTVIHLFYYEDLSIKEIAEALDISESAVKTRLNRGRNHLKEKIGEEADYE